MSTHYGGNTTNVVVFPKCRLVVSWTRNVSEILVPTWCACYCVLSRIGNIIRHNVATTTCPHFAGTVLVCSVRYFMGVGIFSLLWHGSVMCSSRNDPPTPRRERETPRGGAGCSLYSHLFKMSKLSQEPQCFIASILSDMFVIAFVTT